MAAKVTRSRSHQSSKHPPAGRRQARVARLDLLATVTPILIIGATLGSALLFLAREQAIAGTWGFSLDDSWIHAVFARNVATGHGFSFNPNEPVAGSTGPLYSLVLAALYWITGEMIWSAKILGVLCQAASVLFLARAAGQVNPGDRWTPLFCGLLGAFSPVLTWASLSGMEISLYLLFVCAGLYFYIAGRPILATALWAAGVWVRPDGLFLVALSLLGPRSLVPRKLLLIAPILALYVGFNAAIGHSLLPQTVATKAHFGVHADWMMNLIREWGTLWGLPYRHGDQLEHPALLLPLMILGAVLVARRYPLLVLYWVGLPIVFSLFGGSSGAHKRYIVYVVPFGFLLAAWGVGLIRRRLPSVPPASWGFVAVICLLWQAVYLDRKATTHGWNVQNINGMQVTLGKIAAEVTQPGATVGASDIGAIGYFSGRRIVDLVGLVTRRNTLPENLTLYRPAIIIVDMEWFRGYARRDPASGYFAFYDADSTHKYTALGGVELLHNTISSTTQMIVFQRQGLNDPPAMNKFRISS
jgi:arabinofuranosyltransferase